jgi:hemerythrin superfamily protein
MLPWPIRERAFGKLVRLLAVHEAAEEAHVHPVVRHISHAGRELAKARRAEEKEAKELLAALFRTGPHGDDYLTMLRKLRRAVLAHAAREEREEFPLLKRVSPLRRAMLGIEVKLTQAVAPTRPHPMVNNEIANKVAAPIFGPLDRGRDMLRRVTPGA